MQVNIYSLKKVLFEGSAQSINCKTASGEITILDHHRPLISMLTAGTVKVVDAEKKEHYIPVQSGFVEVGAKNEVKIIADEAV
jgi:F-type H+-transporting ATPase subunit epsilon